MPIKPIFINIGSYPLMKILLFYFWIRVYVFFFSSFFVIRVGFIEHANDYHEKNKSCRFYFLVYCGVSLMMRLLFYFWILVSVFSFSSFFVIRVGFIRIHLSSFFTFYLFFRFYNIGYTAYIIFYAFRDF
jgi:hypothetical protein